jgi:hypothetical protein
MQIGIGGVIYQAYLGILHIGIGGVIYQAYLGILYYS